ncbi:MAG TPA: GNAT family protein [Candidatus Hydrogenedentes bacterium]|nr:GNAT family protein [Candidatus Hydrogenedentota bacterium]
MLLFYLMISTDHTFIRAADPDDAAFLKHLYTPQMPHSSLLDVRRELLVPTVEELREMLGHKDAVRGAFHAIEDKTGMIRGFCGIRGVNQEAGFAEIMLLFFEEGDYAGPMAGEALEFLCDLGFTRMRLGKVLAHCLDSETALRAFLVQKGFQSEGVQREVLYSQGRYLSLEALSLFPEVG